MGEEVSLEQPFVIVEAKVEKPRQRYLRYRKKDGHFPEETFDQAMHLLERMNPSYFGKDQYKRHTYEVTKLQAVNMARKAKMEAKIKTNPEIANLYYILRVNEGNVLKKAIEDRRFYNYESPNSWADQRIFAEALLMLGDFSGYDKFIHHNRTIFKEELRKLRDKKDLSKALKIPADPSKLKG